CAGDAGMGYSGHSFW
nr:immunoglobulin heavy chain junction region [Macaca mulatta]